MNDNNNTSNNNCGWPSPWMALTVANSRDNILGGQAHVFGCLMWHIVDNNINDHNVLDGQISIQSRVCLNGQRQFRIVYEGIDRVVLDHEDTIYIMGSFVLPLNVQWSMTSTPIISCNSTAVCISIDFGEYNTATARVSSLQITTRTHDINTATMAQTFQHAIAFVKSHCNISCP